MVTNPSMYSYVTDTLVDFCECIYRWSHTMHEFHILLFSCLKYLPISVYIDLSHYPIELQRKTHTPCHFSHLLLMGIYVVIFFPLGNNAVVTSLYRPLVHRYESFSVVSVSQVWFHIRIIWETFKNTASHAPHTLPPLDS